jgi:hypothetical protein
VDQHSTAPGRVTTFAMTERYHASHRRPVACGKNDGRLARPAREHNGTVGGNGGFRIAEGRSMALGALEDENHLR